MSLMSLKSGTDIRGTAIGEKTDLTDEAIRKITKGFVFSMFNMYFAIISIV